MNAKAKEEPKKDEISQLFEGDLKFDNVDPLCARFKMDVKGSDVMGNNTFQIKPEMFPADFDLAKYDVTGSFKFEVVITKK